MWKVIAIVAAACAIVLALYLPFSSPVGIFNTPDENANYFFAELFEKRGELRFEEPLEGSVDNAIHPRGVNVINGFLVPESFLGLPALYGAMAGALQWAGTKAELFSVQSSALDVLSYLTALTTLIALACLYSFFRAFFDRSVSQLAWVAVLTLPVLLYWAGRPFMHTLLFLDLLVIGWWLLIKDSPSREGLSFRWDILAGVVLGGALAMRTSELVWVAVVTVCLLFLPLRSDASVGLRPHRVSELGGSKRGLRILKVAVGALLVLIPLLFLNQDLYGNAFGTGYSVTEGNLIAEEGTVSQLARTSFASQLLFPFGFHSIAALGRFVRYAFGGIWWYVAPMMLGVLVGWRSWYVRVWVLVSLYLILSYGSFNAEIFADPKHPLAATVGAPYLRYWLPIFVFGAPLAAQFFLWFRSMLSTKFYILHSTFYILLVILSLRAVVWAGPESWRAIRENLLQFSETRERIVRATDENAVFLVPRWADRIIFPARRVIVDVEGKDVVQIIKTLRGQDIPVFWLRGRGEIKLEPALSDAGFKLTRRFDVDPKGKVYEIVMETRKH